MKRGLIASGVVPLLAWSQVAAADWLSVDARGNCVQDAARLEQTIVERVSPAWRPPQQAKVLFSTVRTGVQVSVSVGEAGEVAAQSFLVANCDEAFTTAVLVLSLGGRQETPSQVSLAGSRSQRDRVGGSSRARVQKTQLSAVVKGPRDELELDRTEVGSQSSTPQTTAARHSVGILGGAELQMTAVLVGAEWWVPLRGAGPIKLRFSGWYTQPLAQEEEFVGPGQSQEQEAETSWEYSASGSLQLCGALGTRLALCGGTEYTAQNFKELSLLREGSGGIGSVDAASQQLDIQDRWLHHIGPTAALRLWLGVGEAEPFLQLAGSLPMLAFGPDISQDVYAWSVRAEAGAVLNFSP